MLRPFLWPLGHLLFDDARVDAVAARFDVFLAEFPEKRFAPLLKDCGVRLSHSGRRHCKIWKQPVNERRSNPGLPARRPRTSKHEPRNAQSTTHTILGSLRPGFRCGGWRASSADAGPGAFSARRRPVRVPTLVVAANQLHRRIDASRPAVGQQRVLFAVADAAADRRACT